jgi:2-polyprenyl-3-methyl-5-hydroxy-6-metoxy-1,4-benzoquinol methylase
MDFNKPILLDNRNIRKENANINQYFAEVEKESDQFPKVNGVIVDPDFVECVEGCPICNSKDVGQLFVKWGFMYKKCHSCTHVFQYNCLKESVLLKLYAESNSDKIDRKVNDSDYHKLYWNLVHQKYLAYLSSIRPENKNLMDVGCGNGDFLTYCKEHTDFSLSGIDYNVDTHDYLTSILGKDNYYFQKDIKTHDFMGKKFGIITLWGVLEHLVDPKGVLMKCHQMLDKQGLMVMLIPNLYSRAFKILGISVTTLNARGHVQFFTHQSFDALCEQTGFKVIERFQELPIIDLMYNFISFDEKIVDEIVRENESYYYVYVIQKKG